MKRIALVLTAALFSSGCGALIAFVVQFAPENKYRMADVYETTRFTNYRISNVETTPSGVKIDRSGADVDFNHADKLVEELEACMHISIERRAFVVKIAPDWRWQACAGLQLFPCQLPEFEQSKCTEKECPCGCAGILQWPRTVVTTPNLATLKHELIHLITRNVNHTHQAFKCQ